MTIKPNVNIAESLFKLSKFFILMTCLISIKLNAFSQVFTYQNTYTPQQLVEFLLPGAGLNPTNVTFNGSTANANISHLSARKFDATNFPYSQGVFLWTVGSYLTSSDPDIAEITQGNAQNGVILEFDFVATGSHLSLNFIFASTEYTDFTCSEFNDVMALFLSGPGISGSYSGGAKNIALVPGTNVPIGINTVNSGSPGPNSEEYCFEADSNWQANSIYFTTQFGNFNGMGFNGSTISLSAESDLICGEVYHLKIALCNVLDQMLNSGVFFEAGSFTTNPNNFFLEGQSNVLYEACGQNKNLIFKRGSCDEVNDTLIMYTSFSGLAENGVDYNLLGDSVVILPGVDSVYWQISPIDDGLTEGMEDVIITVMNVSSTGDTTFSTGSVFIDDVPAIFVSGQNSLCIGDSISLIATGAESYVWSPAEGLSDATSDSVMASPLITTQYSVIGTHLSGCTSTQTFTINVDECLGIEENDFQFTVFPNPAEDELTVFSNNGLDINFTDIIDLFGRVVLTSFETKFNVDSLEKGTYFAKITHSQGYTLVRFAK